jgi:O-antigen/teichoic acid export membrane protein
MDYVIWGVLLLGMLGASYRALLIWENRTTAFDGWPEEQLRAVPVVIWLGTGFFLAGAVLVLGSPSDGSALAIVSAFVSTVCVLGAIGFGISLLTRGSPRSMVPPHLRAAQATRRSRRRGR